LSFINSIADRRLFFLADEGGLLLIAGTFVDDFKGVVHSETKAIEFNKAWEERYREPPDIDAATREILGLNYVRVGTGRNGDRDQLRQVKSKALGILSDELSGLGHRIGVGAQCSSLLPPGALSRLECSAGPDNALMPESVLPRGRSILGLAG